MNEETPVLAKATIDIHVTDQKDVHLYGLEGCQEFVIHESSHGKITFTGHTLPSEENCKQLVRDVIRQTVARARKPQE